MILTTHEASVKTASVEIKALTVSGKQVTLAVFRQLKNEQLIDTYTGKLVGTPWGTVNYFFGDCRDNHLHIVWQKGDELRRSCVYARNRGESEWTDLYALHKRAGDYLLARWILDGEEVTWRWGYMRGSSVYHGELTYRWLTIPAITSIPSALSMPSKASPHIKEYYAKFLAKDGNGDPLPSEQLLQDFQEGCAAWIAYTNAYMASWNTINSLDQLFIAV